MDDFKANMISHWVEHQSSREEGQPLYLTQFKQADSDSGSEKVATDTKALVHSDSTLERLEEPLETNLDDFPENPKISDTAEAHLEALEAAMVTPMECPDYYSELLEAEVKRTRQAPPPPPRTTPPRTDEMLSPRGEVEGSESPEPLKEPNSLDNIFLQCEQLVENLNEPRKPMVDSDSHRHPLRILSEENLTIVSTFVADVNDLESMEDDEECDPSKFSFFEVPEFTSRNDCPDDQYFETRLRELVRMTCPPDKREAPPVASVDKAKEGADGDAVNLDNAAEPSNKSFSDPRFLREGSSQTLSTFGQTDRGPLSDCQMDQSPESQPDNSQMLMDRSPVDCQMSSPSPLPSPPDDEPLTPQKQFLLLSQTLRHPDGSSNPDLNLVAISDMKRSPGNGQSSSDQEDEIRLNLTTYTDAVNGNQNEPCNRSVGSELPVSEAKPKKKESNNIAARLLRLFGSTRKKNANKIEERRSKSCDRQLEESLPPYKEVLQKDFRSASSSPLKRTEKNKKGKTMKEGKGGKKGKEKEGSLEGRGTPSTLSLAPTEWEFQNGTEEDERNGNKKEEEGRRPKYDQRYNSQPSAGRHAFLPASSLQELSLQREDRKSSGYDSLEGESSSLDSSNDNNELLNGNLHAATEYAVPSDQKEALHYDEVNQLKMEIKRHPNILRREY